MKTRTWYMICSKWIGWNKLGAKVVKARPKGGKYVFYPHLPQYVKTAFDVSSNGPYIESFTSEDAIPTFEKNGARVKRINSIQYLITFDVMRYGKNEKLAKRAQKAKRDEFGRFL